MPTFRQRRHARQILRQQRIKFRKKFGREPGPHDPVFFDPDQDTPQPIPVGKYNAGMLAAIEKAFPGDPETQERWRRRLLVAFDKSNLS